MTSTRNDRNLKRLFASMLASLTVLATCPLGAFAQAEAKADSTPKISQVIPPPPQPTGGVRTGTKTVTIHTPKLTFSAAPTDGEITNARVFLEPIQAISAGPVEGENKAVVEAIRAFKAKNDLEDLSALSGFLSKFPKSRWAPSIACNVADLQYGTGFLTDALDSWTAAFSATKDKKDKAAQAINSHALASLLVANARIGRMEELEKLLATAKGRAFYGSDELRYNDAKQGLALMKRSPGTSFKCGPYAVNTILQMKKNPNEWNEDIKKYQSTKEGTNLAMLKELAAKVGLKMEYAKRAPGAAMITPCLMHWKLNHFAALTTEKNGHYQLRDATFDSASHMWLSTKAIDTQSDGYFLIPAEKVANLPSGWSAVSEDEAKNVWGKGVAGQRFPNVTGTDAPHSCMNSHLCYPECDKKGMAQASALSMNATLNIQDTPLGYSPPVGPDMAFHLNYAHMEAAQPTTFTFTNLGQNWTFNWLSYLTVDPTSSVATVRIRGGGSEVFTPNPTTGLYPPDFMSQATLVKVSSTAYQRQLADGTIEVFNQSDTSSPPRIFLTSVVDPHGNSVSVQYDSNFRITTITDSIGQVSTIGYLSNTVGNVGFYKVSTITDPFLRSCSFTYDSTTTNLVAITDVINLKSQFAYDTSSTFISQMTTPYGTTSFYNYSPGTTGIYPAQGLRFSFPDGTSSVIENWIDETKTTYFWDRHATQLYPADPANKVYSHCELMKWTIAAPTAYEAPTLQWKTHPLESQSPIYYTYAGVTNPDYTGTSNQPLSVTRSLGNPVVTATIGGTITPGDIVYLGAESQYIANYTVQAGDTTSTIATNLANIINSNPTLQSLTVVATAIGSTVTLHSDLGYVYSYPGAVSPGATETISVLSPTKQSANATMSGTLTVGDVIRVYLGTPYPHTGSGQQYFHTVIATDTYNSIITDLANQMNADPVAQAFQASASVSGATINFVSYNPNTELWQTGVSSGSGSESFLLANVRTNSTQTSEYQRNALSKMTQAIDPIGRKFSYSYASNNIDLLEARETQGTDNYLMTHFEYNGFHNPTIHIDGSGQQTHYTYNSLQQPLTITDANSNVTTFTYTGTSKATIGGTVTVGNVVTIVSVRNLC